MGVLPACVTPELLVDQVQDGPVRIDWRKVKRRGLRFYRDRSDWPFYPGATVTVMQQAYVLGDILVQNNAR